MNEPVIEVRAARESDIQSVFDLSNEESVRVNSYRTGKIEYSDHVKWFTDKIKDRNCIFLLALSGGDLAGQMRLDIKDGDSVISVSVSPGHRGMGVGKALFKGLLEELKSITHVGRIVADVKENNLESIRFFEKCGFTGMKKTVIHATPSVELYYTVRKETI